MINPSTIYTHLFHLTLGRVNPEHRQTADTYGRFRVASYPNLHVFDFDCESKPEQLEETHTSEKW